MRHHTLILNTITLIAFGCLFVPAGLALATVETFTAPGSSSWTVPANVYSITIECWGGGGAGGGGDDNGNAIGGGGGGGGAYAKTTIAVTPGNSYNYTVGAGAAGGKGTGPAGGNSSFNSTSCVSPGGSGGAAATGGGTAGAGGSGATGDTAYAGGSGAGNQTSAGGGGGSSAGSAAAGNTATTQTGATAVSDGGPGGGGGNSGADGTAPASGPGGGGGGGGARSGGSESGGSGADGQIRLTYETGFPISGTVYERDRTSTTTTTYTVKLYVATSTPSIHSTTTTDANYEFSISPDFVTATTTIVAWVDGAASTTAAAVVRNISAPVSDLHLYDNHLIVRGEQGSSITSDHLAVYDADDDPDLPYHASSTADTLTVHSFTKLYVWGSSTFLPSGTVTVHGNGSSTAAYDGSMELASGATYTPADTTTLAGGLTVGSGAAFSSGHPVLFTATTTGKTIDAAAQTTTLGNVTFDGVGGAWTFNSNATTTNITITNGNVIAPNSLTVLSGFTQNGTFNSNGGTVHFGRDTAWGDSDSGVISVSQNDGDDAASAITIDTDNNIYVAGDYYDATNADDDWQIRKYDESGDLDTTWGDSDTGIISVSNNDGGDAARAITIDADNNIYVAGSYYNATNADADWQIRKYDQNGDLDTTWGDSDTGIISVSNNDGNDSAYAITIDASNSIYVAGDYYNATNADADWQIRKYDQNGDLDTTWGDSDTGIISVSSDGSSDYARAIAIDASNSIYVAGDYYNVTNADQDWQIRKYDQNGDLDTTWGDSNTGIINVSNNDGYDSAYAITIDAANNIYVAGDYYDATNADDDWQIRKYDESGDLDTTWGDSNTGIINVSNNDGYDSAYAITIDAANNIYVAGYYYNTTNADDDWQIRKYDESGDLDTTWGDSNTGIINVSNNDGYDSAYAITIDTDNNIYVAGEYYNLTNTDDDWQIRMYYPNQTTAGTMVGASAFHNVVKLGSTTLTINGAASTSDLTIFASSTLTAPTALTIAGDYTNNGTFDSNSGTVYVSSTSAQTLTGNLTASSSFHNLSLLESGAKTLSSALEVTGDYTQNSTASLTGTTTFSGASAQTLSGSSVLTFNGLHFAGAGTKTLSSNASTSDLYIDSTSGTVTLPSYLTIDGDFSQQASISTSPTTLYFTYPNSTLSGTLSGNSALGSTHFLEGTKIFGGDGIATSSAITDGSMEVVYEGDSVYIVGYDDSPDWRIEKRSIYDGELVLDFGENGVVTSASSSNIARAAVSDGTYLYVVGEDGNADWRIEKRALSDGSLDTGFGTSGVVTGAAASDSLVDVAHDGTHLYLVGDDSATDWRIEKRALSDGSLDTGFGTSGVVTGAAASVLAYAVVHDGTHLYIVGSADGSTGSYDWRIEKRTLSTGSLDSGFGSSGIISIDVGGSVYAYPNDVFHDDQSLYVLGNQGINLNRNLRIEKRALSDGALVSGFGSSGVVSETLSYGLGCMASNDSHLFVTGYEVSGGNWRLEKRSLSTGSFDSGFGSSGVVTGVSVSYGNNPCGAIGDTYLYVTGRDGTGWRTEKRRVTDGVLQETPSNNAFTIADTASTTDFLVVGATTTVTAPSRLSIAGDLSNSGTIDFPSSGALTFLGTTAQTISGTLTATSALPNVTFSKSGTKTFSSNASTSNFTIATSSGTVTFPSVLTIGGSLTQNSTFDSNGGTAYFGRDTAWGDNDSGVISVSQNAGNDSAYAITIDASNNTYVAGYYNASSTGTDYDWQIRKYNESGDLDTTWGDSDTGIISVSQNDGSDYARAITIDSSNNIYVAGEYYSSTNADDDWQIRKYDQNGDLDTTWGDSDTGIISVSNNDPYGDAAHAITIDTDNNIYVAGDYYNDSNADRDWQIRKYDQNGDLDTTWGDSDTGIINVSNNDGFDSANAITIDSSNNIYVAGEYENVTNSDLDWQIRKYDANGDLDTTWGDSDTGIISVSNDDEVLDAGDSARAIAIDSSNSIYVAGGTSGQAWEHWNIRKYDANGDLDTTWGDSDTGIIQYNASSRAITIDTDNNIYVAGDYYNDSNADRDWQIRKYDQNGDLDTTWGDSDTGIINVSNNDGSDSANAITIDSSNNIYVAGEYYNATNADDDWHIRKYYPDVEHRLSGTLVGTSALADVITFGSSAVTFANNASTSDFTILSASTTVTAPTALSIVGNYTNNGTFTHNNGVVYFSGTSAQTATGTLSATSSFYDLTITNTSGLGQGPQSVTFGAPVTASGTFTMLASTSAAFPAGATSTFYQVDWQGNDETIDPVWLRSTSPGTQWNLDISGSQLDVQYVNVADSNASSSASGAVTATSSTDAGNNSNWTFVEAGAGDPVVGTSSLGDHDATQVDDAFDFQNKTNEALFAFKLNPESGNATVTELVVTLSGAKRIDAGDFSNLRLFRDFDADAAYDATDGQVGGAGVMSLTGKVGTITFSTDFLATTTQNYVLIADWNAPSRNSSLNLDLYPSGVSAIDANGAQTITGSVNRAQHSRSTSGGGGSVTSAPAPAGRTVETGGAKKGGELIGDDPNYFWPKAHTGAWNNGQYAYDQVDGTYATTSLATSSDFSNHGFSVPGTNEITGIEVKLEISGTTAAGDITVTLSPDGGGSWTSGKTTPTLTVGDKVISLGGESDAWGRTWSGGEFSDSNFRVQVTSNNAINIMQIDALQVRVYHQATGGSQGGGGAI